MWNAASNNSTQNASDNVSSVKTNASVRLSNVCRRSNALRSVCVRSARCVIHVKRPENTWFCGENIVFYKPSGRRMRGIAKILSHTVQHTLRLRRVASSIAHHFAFTFLNFEKRKLIVWISVLKIRVSVVRFRPRPPIQDAQLFSVGRFHLGHPHSTRGAAQFYVCQPPPVLGSVLPPKSHIPPSLLTKLLQTLTLWHMLNHNQN